MSATAQRYAAALADVAMEQKSAEAVKRDLAAFVEMFFSSADLRNALESPAVNRDLKLKVITMIAGKMGLKKLAARMAVERAEALLRKELTPKSEAALFQAFVQELERSVI